MRWRRTTRRQVWAAPRLPRGLTAPRSQVCGCRTAPRSQRCGTRAHTIQSKAGTPACLQKGAARATTARAHGAPVLEDYSSTCYVPSLYSLRVGISVRDVGRIPKPVPGTRPEYIYRTFLGTFPSNYRISFPQITQRHRLGNITDFIPTI